MMSRRALAVLTAAALSGGFALAAPSQASAAPTSLMFSVYIEGSSNNKALEVYNPTGASVDLSDYAVAVYSNGATSPSITIDMTGTPYSLIHLHAVHPPPPAICRDGRLEEATGAVHFCTAATEEFGRFSGTVSLRRLHAESAP